MDKLYNRTYLKERRNSLRNNMTSAEAMLWSIIKSKQLGVKFRRQHSIGNYIVDFYSSEIKLVIEKDGTYSWSATQTVLGQIQSTFEHGTWMFSEDKTSLMLLTEGGEKADLKILGNSIHAMNKATFYFIISILALVDIVQSKYQKNLMKKNKI